MKPRHAAALALVGWYLLLPPINLDSKAVLDIDAPFSKWEIYKAFDSAADCEASEAFLMEKSHQFEREGNNFCQISTL
jgi:hypothetical protein